MTQDYAFGSLKRPDLSMALQHNYFHESKMNVRLLILRLININFPS